ncbi:MAG: hypothetical protein R3E45_07230 [Rhodocyclaceae bacterium]
MALLKSAMIEVLPNFGVLAAPEDPTQSVDIRPTQIESLIRFARANFDYVILDVAARWTPAPSRRSIWRSASTSVLQLTLPFLRDAKRLFDVHRLLDYPLEKVRPILNRVERSSGEFRPSRCGKSCSSTRSSQPFQITTNRLPPR